MPVDHDNLEEFRDAVSYDLEDQSDTGVAFYSALARETGGPILEIGCGTGRVCIPIAAQGFAVTGLDIVPEMVDRARSKSVSLPITWLVGDGRTFDLGQRFRLIFLTGNAFQLFLTRTDQEELFARVHNHLHEEGLFSFETRNPCWRTRTSSKGLSDDTADQPFPAAKGTFAYLETRGAEKIETPLLDVGGRLIRRSTTQTYDHVNQILTWTGHRTWRENDQAKSSTTRLSIRYTFPQELEALLHYNGFTRERCYGDWDYSPLAATSPSIISVCKKKSHRSIVAEVNA